MNNQKSALVVSCMPFSRSNRGIDIITQALVDLGFETTHLVSASRSYIRKVASIGEDSEGLKQEYLPFGALGYYDGLMGNWPRSLASSIIKRSTKQLSFDFAPYDLIVIESGKPALLCPLIPKNKLVVYRQSDAMSVLFRNAAMQDVEKEVIEQADGVLVVRDASKNQFLYGMGGDKTVTIVNGFDSSSLEGYRCNDIRSVKSKKQAIYVGYSPIDVDIMANLSKTYPDVLFHIVGNCMTRKGKKLLEKCDNVRVHGVLKSSEYLPLIAQSDVGIVPYAQFSSLPYIGMNSKYLLFMYMGLPIVSMDVGFKDEFPASPFISFCGDADEFVREFGKQLDRSDEPCAYDVDFDFYSKDGRLAEYSAYFKELMGIE